MKLSWQQICTDSITVATRPNLPHFQSFVHKNKNLSKVCQTFIVFGAEGSAGLPDLPNVLFLEVGSQLNTNSKPTSLPFSEVGSQSSTNSESTKSTVFRICTNRTHPIFDVIKLLLIIL